MLCGHVGCCLDYVLDHLLFRICRLYPSFWDVLVRIDGDAECGRCPDGEVWRRRRTLGMRWSPCAYMGLWCLGPSFCLSRAWLWSCTKTFRKRTFLRPLPRRGSRQIDRTGRMRTWHSRSRRSCRRGRILDELRMPPVRRSPPFPLRGFVIPLLRKRACFHAGVGVLRWSEGWRRKAFG